MTAPSVAFLGVFNAEQSVSADGSVTLPTNIKLLRSVLASRIYPFSPANLSLLFAVFLPGKVDGIEQTIYLKDPSGKVLLTVDMRTGPIDPSPLGSSSVWIPMAFPLYQPKASIVIYAPGLYRLYLKVGEIESELGCIPFVFVADPPLTEDRRAAIRSMPNAVKMVRFTTTCKACKARVRVYTALERSKKLEKSGWQWYEELPASYKCSCGQLQFDFQYLRQNFHYLLGHPLTPDGVPISTEVPDLPITPLVIDKVYDVRTLQAIRDAFVALLDKAPPEEAVQQFIEDNGILLHTFGASRLFHKGKVLGKYVTDIAILNNSGNLVLIELEPPSMLLATKEGAPRHKLNHAVRQVHDWLEEVTKYRGAVLEGIADLTTADVKEVEGVVIAGRESNEDPERLRKLLTAGFKNVRLLTYDDLLRSLDSLIISLTNLK